MSSRYEQPEPINPDTLELIKDQRERQLGDKKLETDKEALKRRKQAEEAVRQEEQAQRKAVPRSLVTVKPRKTHWLWKDRIPLGELTIMAGRGGIGKSLFLTTLAAWITTGDARGDHDGTPQPVIFIANEDSYDKTVVPRLIAAGADMSLVYTVDIRVGDDERESRIILPEDCSRLEEVIKDTGAVAVIVDPLSSNMSDKDRNSPEVRQSYERLRLMAERSGVAIIGNGHTRKGQSTNLLEALMGSSEIGNVVRSAIGLVRDPDAEEPTVVLSQCKNNLGSMDLKSYTYRIENYSFWGDGGNIQAGRLVWGDSTTKHVDDILNEPTHLDSKTDVDEAKTWLKDYLGQNPDTERKKVVAEATKAGFKEHTLKRAAKAVASSRYEGHPRVARWSLRRT